jgi:hypothetical protein
MCGIIAVVRRSRRSLAPTRDAVRAALARARRPLAAGGAWPTPAHGRRRVESADRCCAGSDGVARLIHDRRPAGRGRGRGRRAGRALAAIEARLDAGADVEADDGRARATNAA